MTTIRIPEAPATDAWFAPDEYSSRALARAVSTETDGVMTAPICGVDSPLQLRRALPFACSRAEGHEARHIAVGVDVVAAWPGTHEPTLADLSEPTPPAVPAQPAENGQPTCPNCAGGHEAAQQRQINRLLGIELDQSRKLLAGLNLARTTELRRLDEAEAELDRVRATAASLEAGFAALKLEAAMWRSRADQQPDWIEAAHAAHAMELAVSRFQEAMDEYPHGEEDGRG